jgi:hypothetical protein
VIVCSHIGGHRVVGQRGWRLSLGELRGYSRGIAVRIVVLTIHLVVLSDAPLPCLAAHQCPPHGTRHDSTRDNDDGSTKDDPSSPAHMWNKQQNIDQESEQRDQEGREGEDEQREEVAR